eukprot:TRINITY_DN3170_c0_g1_i2.p1 TRINITY_DN3170_c0_g1~~TRINITY_DN3170_c0_g1_i2.p1  ORF type:complete len:336 (-),score=32.85 TRINITY_DN3170_c0_g1_i2:44-1051(-)
MNSRLVLESFLRDRQKPTLTERIEQDLSAREYFRVVWDTHKTAIACVYPAPFCAKDHTYIDTTNLFLHCNLPVAKIYDVSESHGIIVHEDFGDSLLVSTFQVLSAEDGDVLLKSAIQLIARIQASTPQAYKLNSLSSRLKFDKLKLAWELDFFKVNYFNNLKNRSLSEEEDRCLAQEFVEIASELESRATVLTHRDFHSANLMIDNVQNNLQIIDHQDARIGSVTYDLVSLLYDRVKEREQCGLERIEQQTFIREFCLQAIQRCLKAAGSFSHHAFFSSESRYIVYIEPAFQIVLQNCQALGRFKNLQKIILREVASIRSQFSPSNKTCSLYIRV